MHNRTQQAAGAGALGGRAIATRAFTLVEMLVVIMIIGILVGMMMPTLGRVRVSILVQRSKTTINQVDGAIRLYHSDHEEYPAGADVLVEAVATRWSVARGVTYGPYNGADGLARRKALKTGETDPSAGTGSYMFHDEFDNPILYYVYRQDTGRYDPSAITGLASGVPSNLNAYLKGEGGQYYRKDFVLITRGVDHEWEPAYAGGKWTDSDDLSNLFPD